MGNYIEISWHGKGNKPFVLSDKDYKKVVRIAKSNDGDFNVVSKKIGNEWHVQYLHAEGSHGEFKTLYDEVDINPLENSIDVMYHDRDAPQILNRKIHPKSIISIHKAKSAVSNDIGYEVYYTHDNHVPEVAMSEKNWWPSKRMAQQYASEVERTSMSHYDTPPQRDKMKLITNPHDPIIDNIFKKEQDKRNIKYGDVPPDWWNEFSTKIKTKGMTQAEARKEIANFYDDVYAAKKASQFFKAMQAEEKSHGKKKAVVYMPRNLDSKASFFKVSLRNANNKKRKRKTKGSSQASWG